MDAKQIIEKFGGQPALAELIKVSQDTVALWAEAGAIPARWHPKLMMLAIQREIGIKASDLAPAPSPRESTSIDQQPQVEEAIDAPAELSFDAGAKQITLRFEGDSQAIWATTKDIADLFEVGPNTIVRHIQNIYADDELEEKATSTVFVVVQMEGERSVKRPVTHYSLDVILSVGYRVNAKRATAFRKWATQTLRAYLDQGYVINEKALRESPEKLNRLAAQIRSLRSEERQVYAKVRECFKISSSDFDAESKHVKTFYALLQDKFHHAVTGSTASKLIMDRADHKTENMGLQSMKGERPTLADASTGKNYLKPEEIYRLHLLSEQFLLYAESTALAGKNMTMESLHRKLDQLLEANDYQVFDGYKDYIKDQAIQHAKLEYEQYKKRKKIERLGVQYDEDALAAGEYDSFLAEG